jgi:hypothetical protein
MSATKITSREAWSIAAKISDKAFEHLLDPVNKKLNTLGKEAYEKIIEGIGGESVAKKLVVYGLAYSTRSVDINVVDANNEILVTYTVENETLIKSNYHHYNKMKLVDGPLYDKIIELDQERDKLLAKCSSLRNTLEHQITGKSTKTVVKAWPEAEEIVNNYFGQVSDTTLVTPLETLLARFLPMLPAPAPQEA